MWVVIAHSGQAVATLALETRVFPGQVREQVAGGREVARHVQGLRISVFHRRVDRIVRIAPGILLHRSLASSGIMLALVLMFSRNNTT